MEPKKNPIELHKTGRIGPCTLHENEKSFKKHKIVLYFSASSWARFPRALEAFLRPGIGRDSARSIVVDVVCVPTLVSPGIRCNAANAAEFSAVSSSQFQNCWSLAPVHAGVAVCAERGKPCEFSPFAGFFEFSPPKNGSHVRMPKKIGATFPRSVFLFFVLPSAETRITFSAFWRSRRRT